MNIKKIRELLEKHNEPVAEKVILKVLMEEEKKISLSTSPRGMKETLKNLIEEAVEVENK